MLEKQFGFMPGKLIMEVIYLLRRLVEKKKDLHMVFIDDRVPKDIIW